MAIQFARVRFIGRSDGGNACRSSAYNLRGSVVYERTGEKFDFTHKGGNVYHEILLPDYVDKKFKDPAFLSNAMEMAEKRSDSQVAAEFLLALDKDLDPKDPHTMEIYKEQIYKFVERKGWVEKGYGVQIDIHEPHEDDKNPNTIQNWHCHGLVTTRAFTKDGLGFEKLKDRDMWPQIRNGYFANKEDFNNGEIWRDIQNETYIQRGMVNRVDLPGQLTQEHIGPRRMRSPNNIIEMRNEDRRIANILALSDGEDLLDRVTKHMSVFSQADLKRAAKIIEDPAKREKLINQALESKNLVQLYTKEKIKTDLYSTRQVREEENSIKRLSSYLQQEKNITSRFNNNEYKDKIASSSHFNSEQSQALDHLLFADSGIRVLCGRAGTGKSRVLAGINEYGQQHDIKIWGIAPTHKAVEGFTKSGYENTDTVKGFLFKLYHDRIRLEEKSLVVIDEAAMLGNSDYKELLRLCTKQKCNVILAGDDRQLSSINRGGMFEVIAQEVGSKELSNIQRQSSNWARDVSKAFSEGNIKGGLEILSSKEKIEVSNNASESKKLLAEKWSNSNIDIKDRLIIAVRNSDVDDLNDLVRSQLQDSGHLRGDAFVITKLKAGRKYEFQAEDRIVCKATDKELGVNNGDFGTLKSVSKNGFAIELDNGKEVRFDPEKYSDIAHGYAATIYKSQGASIKDVYVYHDGFSTKKNAYVAMSRHIKNLNLCINEESTKSLSALEKQLALEFNEGSSLKFCIEEDFSPKKEGFWSDIKNNISSGIQKFADKNFAHHQYYEHVQSSQEEIIEIEKVLQEVREEREVSIYGRPKMAVGAGYPVQSKNHIKSTSKEIITKKQTNEVKEASISSKKMSPKQRFYANKERIEKHHAKIDYNHENELLRNEAKYKTETIACNLLGKANNKLSNNNTLRFGSKGSIAVSINGSSSGTWYDFSNGKGGDMFDLVQENKGCDFKEAANYLRSYLGMNDLGRGEYLQSHEVQQNLIQYRQKQAKQATELKAKIKKSQELFAKAKEVGDKSIAKEYLANRGIKCDLSKDIKTTGIYSKELGKSLPTIVAFARNKYGEVTGGQQISLNPQTKKKADIDIPKKSFGSIAGSFVEINQSKTSDITIIAEGLETAFSIKEAKIDANIYCSLGISNIRNYEAKENEKIIIAGDNDGKESNTYHTLESTKTSLQNKGANVLTVLPSKEGDFNDVLQKEGAEKIKQDFEKSLNYFNSKRLDDFVKAAKDIGSDIVLSKEEKASLEYLDKYEISQENIVESYRNNPLQGSIYLDQMRKQLGYAEFTYRDNKILMDQVKNCNPAFNVKEFIKDLVGIPPKEQEKYLLSYRNGEWNKYLEKNYDQFNEDKAKANNISKVIDVLEKEHNFFRDSVVGRNYRRQEGDIVTNKAINERFESMKKADEWNLDIKEPVYESLKNGFKSEAEILKTLKQNKGLLDLHAAIDKDNEASRIENNLSAMQLERQKTTTAQEAMKALDKETRYLASVLPTLKYQDHHQSFSKKINDAHKCVENNTVVKLYETAHYAFKNSIINDKDLTKHLGSNLGADDIHKNISDICYIHHCSLIKDHYDKLSQGIEVSHFGQKFDCPIKYLEHWKDSCNHNLLPMKQIDQMIDYQVERQIDHSLDM